MPTLLQQIARKLAHSALLRKGQALWELNQNDWNLALSRTENLITVELDLGELAQGCPADQRTYLKKIQFRTLALLTPGDSFAPVTHFDCKFHLNRTPQSAASYLEDPLEGFS